MRPTLGRLCITLSLVLAGCCNDIGCLSILTVTVQRSTAADRVEVAHADGVSSCGKDEQASGVCFLEDDETTRSFGLVDVPEGELTIRVFAADEMLSEEVVTPAWKDYTPDGACDDTVCRQGRVTL